MGEPEGVDILYAQIENHIESLEQFLSAATHLLADVKSLYHCQKGGGCDFLRTSGAGLGVVLEQADNALQLSIGNLGMAEECLVDMGAETEGLCPKCLRKEKKYAFPKSRTIKT